MSWQIELIQQRDQEDNLIPFWTVIQWNTNNPNTKYESTITDAVKQVAYPEE
jgi:hypothetical protein